MHRALFLLLVAVELIAAVQAQTSTPSDIAKLSPEQAKARDQFQDEIAKKVMNMRQSAGVPKLRRFDDRKLRELTCSLALNSGVPKSPWIQMVGSVDEFGKEYEAEIQREKRSYAKHSPPAGSKAARFAVGAWPAREPEKYWVEIEYHYNEFLEWVNNTFTDDVFYSREWKKMVAEPCWNVK